MINQKKLAISLTITVNRLGDVCLLLRFVELFVVVMDIHQMFRLLSLDTVIIFV